MLELNKGHLLMKKKKKQPLSNWLAWGVTRKDLAEIVHSVWVAQKTTQLSLLTMSG